MTDILTKFKGFKCQVLHLNLLSTESVDYAPEGIESISFVTPTILAGVMLSQTKTQHDILL